ncbi:hypothetical protein QBC39DRAFT_37609 [Podospora conica]|nr:hypothetical protein QBC39DRAFT_37609 [Schizothecium conicum]
MMADSSNSSAEILPRLPRFCPPPFHAARQGNVDNGHAGCCWANPMPMQTSGRQRPRPPKQPWPDDDGKCVAPTGTGGEGDTSLTCAHTEHAVPARPGFRRGTCRPRRPRSGPECHVHRLTRPARCGQGERTNCGSSRVFLPPRLHSLSLENHTTDQKRGTGLHSSTQPTQKLNLELDPHHPTPTTPRSLIFHPEPQLRLQKQPVLHIHIHTQT